MGGEVGRFTKDIIPKIKALVAKRWAEGNPICVSDPMEYMIPYYADLLVPIIKEELQNERQRQADI